MTATGVRDKWTMSSEKAGLENFSEGLVVEIANSIRSCSHPRMLSNRIDLDATEMLYGWVRPLNDTKD